MKYLYIILLLLITALNITAKDTKFVTHVTVTTYSPTAKQCGNNKAITKNGTKINLNDLKYGRLRIVAISRDLLWAIPMDSIIEVEGYGQYIVADLMGPGKKHYIDILQHPGETPFKKDNVKITVIRKGNAAVERQLHFIFDKYINIIY